jgi:murein DD-endopeptidase MepM/ murein hydrolase activator NlpD
MKRFQVRYRTVFCLATASILFGLIGLVAFSSYMRMFIKVSNYNALRMNFDNLQNRYHHLEQVTKEHNQEMASLESLAGEISASYGINEPGSGQNASTPMDSDFGDTNVKESIDQFNFLKAANYSHIYHHYAARWQSNIQPTIWPIVGAIRSAFGGRSDPFSGEGAFHTGIDLTASIGTKVHVTADGTVESTSFSGRYGKLIIVDHGNGIKTYYAHLSQFLVVPGQEVRRSEIIGLTGATGRVTGPHLHYEVRVAGTPVNPYKYMGKPENTKAILQAQGSRDSGHNDLGL